MARVPLIGGAYEARSVIANAQRRINYYPELNRRDAPVPVTHYQRPGLVPLIAPAVAGAGRGLFQASNGACYAVAGNTVYYVEPDFSAMTALGTITPLLTTPVSMIDNGTSLVIVDGSTSQWQVDLLTNVMSPLVDASGNFAGATRVDTLDTFIIWNRPGTRQFGATFSNVLTTDGISFASKATYPDPIQTLIVRRTEIILIGRLKSEIWYNIGGVIFPFARLPGAYIEYGTAAPYSVAANDVSVFWVSRSLEGEGIVIKVKGYEASIISNPAISAIIQAQASFDDIIAWSYQQNGHIFYVLNFVAGDETWVYDDSIPDPMLAWHQQAWTDADGVLHRHRGNAFAQINRTLCCIDWENGTIYHIDQNTYTDTVDGQVYDISFIVGFPEITQAANDQGELVPVDDKSVNHLAFIADMDLGNVAGQIWVRWSDDRGHTWGQAVLSPQIGIGAYRTQEKWAGLGTAKGRVYELAHSLRGSAALNSAWLEARINAQ